MLFRLMVTLSVLTVTCGVHADALISFTTKGGESSDIAVRQGVVSMGLDDNDTLFNSKDRKMVMIDHQRRAYYEMDKESMQSQLESFSDSMSAQMEQMLAQVPESQRELMKQQMQQMMGQGSMGGAPSEPWEFNRSGQSATVNGFDCAIIEVSRGGQIAQRVCVTSAAKLGISAADTRTLETMFEFMQEMSQAFSGMMQRETPEPIMNVKQLGGVPIRIEDVRRGEVSEVSAVSTASQPADKFKVPNGYQKSSFPGQ